MRVQHSCLQVSVRRGTSRSWDHAQLVHHQWLQLAMLGVAAHIVRVGTHDNIADLPSREEFALLRARKAKEVAPILDETSAATETWEVLKERWRLL